MDDVLPVSRDTFQNADNVTKLGFLYDIMTIIHAHNVSQCQICKTRMLECEAEIEKRKSEYLGRIENLEGRGLVDKAMSFAGGVLGGATAMIAKHWMWK